MSSGSHLAFGDAHVIDRPFLRSTSPELTDDQFLQKWSASQGDPLLFFRSYPAGYHKDMASVTPMTRLGPEGMCLGDSHPENFGFLKMTDGTRFAFNDLDDSGPCPIGFDAARYFAALSLLFHDDNLTAQAIAQYTATINDDSAAVELDPSTFPNWDSVRKKGLGKLTDGQSSFLMGTADTMDLGLAQPDEDAAVRAIFASETRLSGRFNLLSLVAEARDFGGSGGLRRYLLMVEHTEDASIHEVIELKEVTTPGVEFGDHSRTLSRDTRLHELKAAFWQATDADDSDNFYVTIGAPIGSLFLVRNKYTKKSLDVADSNGNLVDPKIVMAQATQMARVHRADWKQSGITVDAIKSWLTGATPDLTARWSDARTRATMGQ
jgi:hypothetical protein